MANGPTQVKAGNAKAPEPARMRRLESYVEMGNQTLAEKLKQAKELAANGRFQSTAATAAGGAAVLGAGGAAVGTAVGGALGCAIGFIPALFTFGLSIPIGAAIGGGCGMVTGATVVGGAGFVGGGALGYFGYANETYQQFQAQFVGYVLKGYSTVIETFAFARARLVAFGYAVRQRCSNAYTVVEKKTAEMTAETKKTVGMVTRDVKYSLQETAQSTKNKAVATVSDKTFQVTAASATGGAVALGSTGAAVGFVGGGAVGAAVGVVPAIFTFGLSIPIGAAIGSACGAVSGSVVGGTTGLVGGGAVGYGYTKRAEIKTGVVDVASKVSDRTSCIKETVVSSAGSVKSRVLG